MLSVRNAKIKDIPAIIALTKRVYPNQAPYTRAMLLGQLNNFTEGQFVAEYNDEIVGYCSSIVIKEKAAFAKGHTWESISGGGFGSTHDQKGDYLYGIEVCVDPRMRKLRIGHRLYQQRKRLCEVLGLKGIVFAGRMPGYHKKANQGISPKKYIEGVVERKYRDTTLGFQLRQGFEVLGVLRRYLPEDLESKGNGVHLLWKNPKYVPTESVGDIAIGRTKGTVRVGTVQYMQRKVLSFEEFAKYIEYFVDVVGSYHGDFVVFPEFVTLQLMSIENDSGMRPSEAVADLTRYTDSYVELMKSLAIKYNINIVGGSHPTRRQDGTVHNVCYVFLRQGTVHEQEKIHPTPDETYWWDIKGGDDLNVIETDCGPIGILICYDSEFPELARYLIDQGAKMLFVPFCTDERQSYLRVRYCCQARAIENQCYMVLSGNVGNLPGVANMDIQYAQSCILTPCDFPFARDGIAADTTPNVETVAMADLRLDDLAEARASGTVQNLKNRRHDLYRVQWRRTSKMDSEDISD